MDRQVFELKIPKVTISKIHPVNHILPPFQNKSYVWT
jgi:hypothetical protein